MLGRIAGLAAAEEFTYILDSSVPTIRVYDAFGRHVRDIGTRGSGPGEFRLPTGLALGTGGHLFVKDLVRVSVFDADAQVIATWTTRQGGFRVGPRRIVAAHDGGLYIPSSLFSEPWPNRLGHRLAMVPYSLDGTRGEPLREPSFDVQPAYLTSTAGPVPVTMTVPFLPYPLWGVTPSGKVIRGIPDKYEIFLHEVGGPSTKAGRNVLAVPVERGEKEWHRRRITAAFRYLDPGWAWHGPEIPDVKPFYDSVHADWNERLWVFRQGAGNRIQDCDEHPQPQKLADIRRCWESELSADVFDDAGTYLGEVDFPNDIDFRRPKFIRDNIVLLAFEDEAGVSFVRRYRLLVQDR